MRKKHFLLLLAFVLTLGAVGGTWGYHRAEASVVNRISTRESGVTMREVFNPADKWLPGETKEKKVSFSNSGESPQVIRFRYDSRWSDSSGNPVAEPTTVPAINRADTENWQPLGGWYYYKRALQPGEVTAEVITSIRFDKSLTNGGYDGKADYSDKRYTLTVTMEALDVNSTETAAGWGVTFVSSGGALTWSDA